MAKHRPKVGIRIKQRLQAEAGGKCANPGCPSRRTHVHHIKKWAVYSTHDENHMIAVCPTCHDAIHHGDIQITDELLYTWKQIKRVPGPIKAHLYVEPAIQPFILLGSVSVRTAGEVTVFELSPNLHLKFRVQGNDIILLELTIGDRDERTCLCVIDNYVSCPPTHDMEYRDVPGHIEITVPVSSSFVPSWVLMAAKDHQPHFVQSDRIELLSLLVEEPGVVRVKGCWSTEDYAVIIGQGKMSFLERSTGRVISICGAGKATALIWQGPITTAMFGMGPRSAQNA